MKAKKQAILPIITLMCALFFSSCDKENALSLSIKKTEISLKHMQEEAIIVSPSPSECIFISDNKYIAHVSSTGKVTGITVGTTYITITNPAQKFTARCKVTVTPSYNLFREPYLGFGAAKSTVKAIENRKLASETSTSLGFTGENSNITLVMYLFDAQGNMTSASVLFPISKVNATVDFLAERYFPLGAQNGYGIFMSNDEKMAVGITVYNTSYLVIIYTPITSSKSSTTDTVQKQIIELMDNHFKQQ